jgi:hypothetical protein
MQAFEIVVASDSNHLRFVASPFSRRLMIDPFSG